MAAPVASYRVIRTFPHSTESYTEGFFYLNGMFYEGTGLSGRSAILVTRPETGKIVQRLDLSDRYFGEGIVDFGPNLYEWTWQSHVGFVYDRFSLRPIQQFQYTGDGWGMTRDHREIITSDGSDTLRFRDPASFRVTRQIIVKDGRKRIDQLNELEYVKGEIFANVWHDRPHRTNLAEGRPHHRLDRPQGTASRRAEVKRGIGAERHRLRRRARPSLCNRKTVAEDLEIQLVEQPR